MIDLSNFDYAQLELLNQQIEMKKLAFREEVERQHHSVFLASVSLELVERIPIVAAEVLGLNNGSKYHKYTVIPEMMGSNSVLRGLDGSNRPFIAIKVALFDVKTGEKITEVVEVIFKKYSLDGDGANNAMCGCNYITALDNLGSDQRNYQSGLYSSGGMIPKQFERVGQLLRGERIPHEFRTEYLMQKV